MSTQATSINMESLPKQFVAAMRTLFDIMDDKNTGYVKLTDIENRWRDDRTKGLPRGVIESLQKVTLHDGLLTFERFCTGLKICLLQNQVENASSKAERLNSELENSHIHSKMSTKTHRPPSAPLLDANETQNIEINWNLLKKSENITQHRTLSMPQLISRKEQPLQELRHSTTNALSKHDQQRSYGPPKPPRLEKVVGDRKESSRSTYKSEEEMHFDTEEMNGNKMDFEDITRSVEEQSRGLGDGRSSSETQTHVRKTSRRREPRRHTLHNGVDYNLLKRMKQIEQEKDVLLQGLSAVEEAREWYLKQLTEVQEKMRYAGRMGAYVEPWSEAHQERLELLRARVLELNRQLGALAAGWRHGQLSLHMNLALPTMAPSATTGTPNNATVLRSQNRMLAEIQDDSGDLHGISQPAVSKICKNVAEAIAKRAHSYISMPSSLEDQTEVIRQFKRISNFPTVIGAIDCTHIKIKRVSGDLSEAYVNRKGYYSLNVQVVCDSNLKIRDIVARWRGSVHDSRIFNESTLKERFENGEFHGRLLGDSGYACTPYLFTPLLHPTSEKEEAYNKAHIKTRNTVERCFGLLKQRFRCLLRGLHMKLSTARTTIVALAVLHNIAIDMNENIDIVQYVRHRRQQPQNQRDTLRGIIIRRNFINENF